MKTGVFRWITNSFCFSVLCYGPISMISALLNSPASILSNSRKAKQNGHRILESSEENKSFRWITNSFCFSVLCYGPISIIISALLYSAASILAMSRKAKQNDHRFLESFEENRSFSVDNELILLFCPLLWSDFNNFCFAVLSSVDTSNVTQSKAERPPVSIDY